MTQQETPQGSAAESDIESRVAEFLTKTDPSFAEDDEKKEGRDTEPSPSDEETEEHRAAEEETPDTPDEQEGDTEEGESASEDDEERAVQTLGDLAEHYGMDESELLGELKVQDADGKEITLGAALDTFRSREDPAAVKARVDELNLQRLGEARQYEQSMGAMKEATDQLLNQLESKPKLSAEQWKELEDDDPVEYMQLKMKDAEQRDALTASIRQIEEAEANHQRDAAENSAKVFQEQMHSLIAKSGEHGLPDWNEAAEGKSAMKLIEKHMTTESVGFDAAELAAVEDHRFLQVAWYAAKYLETLKLGKETVSRVRDAKLPKFSKATARRDPEKKSAEKAINARMARLQETGADEDAVRLFEEML